jgi:hypothetical protein
MSYSLSFCDTCNVRDLIIGATIPRSISLPTCATLFFLVVFHPRDQVTCCAALDAISPSGPRVSFRHVEEQIPLLMLTPLNTPLEYLIDTFLVALLQSDGWCSKAASGGTD